MRGPHDRIIRERHWALKAAGSGVSSSRRGGRARRRHDAENGSRVYFGATCGRRHSGRLKLWSPLRRLGLPAGVCSIDCAAYEVFEFVFADATKLPFADASVDAVTISFGLRNVVDPKKALTEMLRVLKPGGVVVICEFSHVRTPVIGSLYRWYLANILPTLSKLLAKNKGAYDYLSESIAAWPKQEVLVQWLIEAGFTEAKYKNSSLGIVAIHSAKKATK